MEEGGLGAMMSVINVRVKHIVTKERECYINVRTNDNQPGQFKKLT